MKITAQTEAVSSPPEEKWHWSQQWRQNTFRAGQKLKADWKKDLHNLGAGRKSRKPPTPFVGMKPNGKSQIKLSLSPYPAELPYFGSTDLHGPTQELPYFVCAGGDIALPSGSGSVDDFWYVSGNWLFDKLLRNVPVEDFRHGQGDDDFVAAINDAGVEKGR